MVRYTGGLPEKGQDDIVTLPDRTKIYTFQAAKEVFKRIRPARFSCSDVILMLLYAQKDKPINGRVSMMKQNFLMMNEMLGKTQVEDLKFIPYRLGMYSFLVANTLLNLEYAGFITREGKKHSRAERFRLSDKGEELAKKVFVLLPRELQDETREKRKGWDQLGTHGILRYVYSKYPEYVDRSRLKQKYKPIVWGRGLG